MRYAIAIFAKTLGMTPVKTRLAASIGLARADEFYRLSVACIEETLVSLTTQFPDQVFPVWAMAEEASPRLLESKPFPALWTGEGGLGTRLATISDKLTNDHDCVMMIGTDSPQLSVSDFIDVMDSLQHAFCDAVAIPAHDGGYCLFASKRPVTKDTWKAVSYSVSTTLDEFQGLLEEDGFEVKRTGSMRDVDEVSDLIALTSTLSNMETISLSQTKLLDWLMQNADHFESAV